MKHLFGWGIIVCLLGSALLSGCGGPMDAKGTQVRWKATVNSHDTNGFYVHLVNAKSGNSISQIKINAGDTVRFIYDSSSTAGTKVSLCRASLLYVDVGGGELALASTSEPINVTLQQPEPGTEGPGMACPCYTVGGTVLVPTPATKISLLTGLRVSPMMTLSAGATVFFCHCELSGDVVLTPGTVIFVPIAGSDDVSPCVLEGPMNVTITGKVGLLETGALPDPGGTTE